MAKLLFGFLALALGGCSAGRVQEKSGPVLLPLAAEESKRPVAEAYGRRFMIATDGEAATRAGVQMAELGGNAVDSAVAASFAISVERPHSTGLGGGGFLLLRLAKEKKTFAFDFREMAPRRASRDMYLDKEGQAIPGLSVNGALAAGVPGLVAGLLEVHRRYGKLPLAQVLAPAIRLAEEGFPVYGALAEALEDRKDVLQRYPATKKIFFRSDGTPLKKGDLLVQNDLARTLRAIGSKGKDGFYRGWVAHEIVRTSQTLGGLLTHQDLSFYRVKVRAPVKGNFRGFEIHSMPPPSSGGAHVLQILNIVENDPLADAGPGAPGSVHLLASAMQRAFADRAEFLGDTDFVKVPLAGLVSKSYAKELRASIPEAQATPSESVKAGNPHPYNEPEHTTHLTVMDGEGNTVSSTQTINGWMGSGVVAGNTGVVLNNEMDDFSLKPGVANLYGALGGEKNAIAPGKRPLSSMSPTIVLQEGEAVLALGSPSGTRIITCVAQVIANRLLFGLPLYESVASVRYHHQWQPDEIRVDSPGFPPQVLRALEKRGYRVNEKNLGCRVAAVERKDGLLHGVADPRGEGISWGL